MGEALDLALNGPLSRHIIPRRELLVEGRRYRVWLRLKAIAQGSVCVWVGGNRTAFFSTPGDHVEEVTAGEGQAIVVQGLNAIATVTGVAVRDAQD